MTAASPPARLVLICLAAGAASLFFGASVAATRFVIHQTDPLTLAFLRYAIAACCMAAIFLVGRRVRVAPAMALRIAAIGTLVYVGFPVLFNVGIQFVPAARGSLILATVPLFTLLIARLIGHEVLTRAKLMGGALAIIGTAIALGDRAAGGPASDLVWVGDLCMFGACLAGSAYNVFARPLLHLYPQATVASIGMGAGALVLGVGATAGGLFSTPLSLTAGGWAAVGFVAILGTTVAFWLWHWALERTAPSQVAVFGTLSPLAAAGLGAVILAEPISLRFAVGLGFVLAGIIVVNRAPRVRPAPSPAHR